jgi:hypothetical protein
MQCSPVVWFLVLATVLESSRGAQLPQSDQQREQTTFGFEWEPGDIRKPVEVPDTALQVLRDTLSRGPLNCIKGKGTTPDQVPASWFVASEIHLDGPDEVDLIVVPNGPRMSKLPPAASCLLGANVGPFWVLRRVGGRYMLLLETYALRLDVLDSRTNSYRDIQTVASTAVTSTTIVYKMAVAQYQLAGKKSEPNP